MIRLWQSRAVWFLTERLIAQGGGLLFIACLARVASIEDAAAFITAFAFASLFQPLFANACQPLAIRLWRGSGAAGLVPLLSLLGLCSALLIGPLIIWFISQGFIVAAALLVHALLAPLSLASAPLIAEDRWRSALSVLIPIGLLGVVVRISALLIFDDLLLAALLFGVEPLCAGGYLAWRAGLLRFQLSTPGQMFVDAVPLMLAMIASTLFWRAPVLLGALYLTDQAVLPLAFAMQMIAGMMLVPNALCQSLIGPISLGGDARSQALIAGGATAFSAGIVAICLSLLAAEPLMVLIYGTTATGGGALLVILAPLVGLATIWRLTEMTAGLDGQRSALLLTRAIGVLGMAVAAVPLSVFPANTVIAVAAPISLFCAAIVAPMLMRDLRPVLGKVLSGASTLASPRQLADTSAIFLKG